MTNRRGVETFPDPTEWLTVNQAANLTGIPLASARCPRQRHTVRDQQCRSPHRGTAAPVMDGKPCEVTRRSHISHCVYDSTWEATEAFELERNKNVAAWVKNDHLGFEVMYVYGGVVRKYRPDFLIRLATGKMLVLEVKGRDTQQDETKRRFLDEWVKAANEHGGFGHWSWRVSQNPADIEGLLRKA